jgi:hypothetical protein
MSFKVPVAAGDIWKVTFVAVSINQASTDGEEVTV